MRADPSLDANQNRKVVVSITARSIAVKDIGREATIFIRGGRHGQGRIFTPCFRVREARGGFCLSWPADRVTQHSGAISQSRQSNSGQQSGRRVPRERAPSRPKGAIRVSRLSLRTLTPLPCAATDRFRQIDAARKSQMAALATINPHKTTMARLLFINGLRIGKDALMSKPRRVCREERGARRGFAEPTE
jgi:hypothetical protein